MPAGPGIRPVRGSGQPSSPGWHGRNAPALRRSGPASRAAPPVRVLRPRSASRPPSASCAPASRQASPIFAFCAPASRQASPPSRSAPPARIAPTARHQAPRYPIASRRASCRSCTGGTLTGLRPVGVAPTGQSGESGRPCLRAAVLNRGRPRLRGAEVRAPRPARTDVTFRGCTICRIVTGGGGGGPRRVIVTRAGDRMPSTGERDRGHAPWSRGRTGRSGIGTWTGRSGIGTGSRHRDRAIGIARCGGVGGPGARGPARGPGGRGSARVRARATPA